MGRKKKAEAGLDPLPPWVCERNVAMKEKTPLHAWMRQCRKSGNKKMWLLYPGKCHDYRLLLIPIPSGFIIGISNVSKASLTDFHPG